MRMAAFIVALLAAVLILVLSGSASWAIVALLPLMFAAEVGRQLLRDRRSRT
jgi:hypothetical protein